MKIRILIVCWTVLIASMSYGDSRSARPSLPTTAPQEPITGQEVVPSTGDASPPRDPFTPYEAGPSGTRVWKYSQLTPQEKVQLDKGRNAGLSTKTAAAYASAAHETARRAVAIAAAERLGLENLPLVGVIK